MKSRQNTALDLNTASLPDLIFSVLFFFILITHMREAHVAVEYSMPQGTELSRLTRKQNVSHIYIGHPKSNNEAFGYSIQINDREASLSEVEQFIRDDMSHSTAEDGDYTISLRADRHTPMGIVSDVKRQLRRAGAFKICYAATDEPQHYKQQR